MIEAVHLLVDVLSNEAIGSRGGGRSTRLFRPFEKKLNLKIFGPTIILKIQGVDHT